jgi:hypothetical protein
VIAGFHSQYRTASKATRSFPAISPSDTTEIFITRSEQRGYHLIIYDFRPINYAIKENNKN